MVDGAEPMVKAALETVLETPPQPARIIRTGKEKAGSVRSV
jgi:hypothetical protein